MIRIRYTSELRPGLNGQAERLGRTTVVYLLPGLSPAQRAAALRRLRQHGRMGISPRLPLSRLLPALLADRIKMAFGQAGAIVRTHPAGSTLPVMVVSAAVAGFLLLSAVSIRIVHTPLAGGAPGARGPVPAASPGYGSRPAAGPGNSAGPGSAARPGGSAGPGSAASVGPAPGPGAGSAPPGPGTNPSGTAASSSPPGGASSPAPRVSAPAGPPASVSTKVCLHLGPLGVCLGL